MTVTYSDKSFLRLLLRWHGSIWKSIGLQYLIFLTLFFIINIWYRLFLTADQQSIFERVVKLSEKGPNAIPLQFLLGFYVAAAVTRWWKQLNYVAWPDKFLVFVTANIQGDDFDSKVLRKTFARYANLLTVMVWREISVKIRKRFPTHHHLVKSGLMTEKEFAIYEETTPTHGRWFIPANWMINLLCKCRQQGKITDYAHQKILDELWTFRSGSAMLTMYDWVNIPLVYTQVVTIATYGYFAFCLVCRQSLLADSPQNKYDIDYVFPIFTTLEFVFYLGWMKVGEELRCPFGEDDEDFDMNYILDRNIHVSNMVVDELNIQRPEPEQDFYWENKFPVLPHTKASYMVKDKVPNWRLYKMKVEPTLAEFYKTPAPIPLKRSQSAEEAIALTTEGDAAQLLELREKKV